MSGPVTRPNMSWSRHLSATRGVPIPRFLAGSLQQRNRKSFQVSCGLQDPCRAGMRGPRARARASDLLRSGNHVAALRMCCCSICEVKSKEIDIPLIH